MFDHFPEWTRKYIRTVRELQDRVQDQMLESLNDEHKRLVAKLIGQLSVAKVPDLETVASELDDALTSEERNSISEAGSAFEQNYWRAFDDHMDESIRRAREAGQSISLGYGERPKMTHAKPAMTLLILLIEELLRNLNGIKGPRHDVGFVTQGHGPAPEKRILDDHAEPADQAELAPDFWGETESLKDEAGSSVPSRSQLQSRAHRRMLRTLSAERLTCLSRLIGRLAISETPDLAAAARELDGMLTAEEKQAIEATGALLDRKISQFIEALRKRMEQDVGPDTHVGSVADVRTPMTGENPSVILLTSAIEELYAGVSRVKHPHPPKV